MGVLLLPLTLAFFGWLAYRVHRSFVGRAVSNRWHVAFFTSLMLGAALGVYFGFFFEYHASRRLRVFSFPVPAVVFVLERYDDGSERWTDFVTPAPLFFAGSNICLLACAAVLPVWAANTIARLWGHREPPTQHGRGPDSPPA